MSAATESPLALQIKEAQISETDAAVLQSTFAPLFQQADEWRLKADAIRVDNADDRQQMMEARKVRLALKEIRVNAEKSRKALKEESLRKGKAIDGMANIIKFLIVPIEEDLERKESFVRIQEEKAKREREDARRQELIAIGVDPSPYNLAEIPEETYQRVLEIQRQENERRKAETETAERERVEREKAEAEERERIRQENERLRKEAQAERAAKEKAEAELLAKRREEEHAEKVKAEAARRAAVAPDRDKLHILAFEIASFPMPDVSSDEAKAVIKKTIELLSSASQFVKTQAVGL